jgi:hypothetical protein
VLALANHALDRFNTSLAFLALQSAESDSALNKFVEQGGQDFLDFMNDTLHLDKTIEFFKHLEDSAGSAFDEMEKRVDFARNNRFTDESKDMVVASNSMRLFGNNVKAATAELVPFETELRKLALFSKDAEGKLNGLALIFTEIDDAAFKSKASESLDKIGFSAAQIEAILTRPDWATIFGQISRLAKIAALDIRMVTTSAIVEAALAQKTLNELLASFATSSDTGKGGSPAKDFVKEFFAGITTEIEKQQARIKLQGMGASAGLIEAIVGAQGFEEVFAKLVRDGDAGLKKLQREFSRTAAGIDEATAAAEAFAKANEEGLDAATKMAEDFIKVQQKAADEAEALYLKARLAADQFAEGLEELSRINILPDAEIQLGDFESAVVDSVDRIRTELKRAFSEKLIFKEDFDAISQFVELESLALRNIAMQRDDLANRFTLSEALINDYQRALTAGLQLTSLFGSIKKNTETVTVTDVKTGMVSISNSMKEFAVSITRSYEETIDNTVSKSEGLLQGFRDMAQRAREFAVNLEKLRSMGLNGALFDQLVRAGVTASGETAQALVDGGQDSLDEINNLFVEINDLGASMGEEVAATLHGSGIDMVDGLLAGIKSKREELLEEARAMGQAFSDEFNSRVSIAIEKPVAAAKAASDAAAAAVPKIEEIDLAGIQKLNAFLANASKSLGVVKGAGTIAGINTKIDVVEQLRDELLMGGKLDLSGIRSGLSSADLIAAAKASGSQVVNQVFNITAPASSSLVGQYQGGVAFAQGLQTAVAANPNLQVEVFGR